MNTPTPEKLAYTVQEAVKATGVSKSALYEDVAAGKLQLRKRGTRTLILADELRRYVGALAVAA